MTSFLTSILSAITRRWGRADDRVEPDQLETIADVQTRLAAKIAHERERLLGIISNVPGVVWEAWGQPDESTQRIDFISEHVTRMLGYTVEEWLSTPNFWLTIVHPDDREAAAAHAHEHFLAGGARTNTFRWMTKEGRAIWCEAHSTVIHDEHGVPVGMRGITLDISDRKRADESLRAAAIENAQLYRAAVEASASDDVAEAAPVEIAAPRNAAPDLRRKQILVVDNDVDSLESLAGVLRELGARVTTVRSAAEAILALCSHHDLVVTDVGVVVTEGVTLAQQLRQANGGVPAIVLRKPVDPLELAAEISRLLTRPGGA